MGDLTALRKDLYRGRYVVIRMDPVAACSGANDPEITALAKQISTKMYLAVIDDYHFMPKPSWGMYVVSEGLLIPDVPYGQHEGMCTPIFPATEHPRGREELRPNNEFPRKNCYHHSYPGYCMVAVSSISRKGASDVRLPEADMDRLRNNVLSDSYEARELHDVWMQNNASVSNDADAQLGVDPSGENSMLPCPLSTMPSSQASLCPGSTRSTSHDKDMDERSGSVDPYDTFSDVTSIAPSTTPGETCIDGDEVFIRALAACIDPTYIMPTVKLWLDLSVLKSRKLHSAAEFKQEILQISGLYLKRKENLEAQEESLEEQMELAETSKYPLRRLRRFKGISLIRKTSLPFKTFKKYLEPIFRKLFPCGLYRSQKEANKEPSSDDFIF